MQAENAAIGQLDLEQKLGGFTGMTDKPLRHAIEDGAIGIALIAFGRGNVPPTIVPAVRDAVANGALITVSSRSLAGRVSEMVDGVATIHAYDTSNYERGDMARRLGEIFAIRYDLYQWKFMVKFINNFR